MTVTTLPYVAGHGVVSVYNLYESSGMVVCGIVIRNYSLDEIQKPGTNVTKPKRSMGQRV